MDKFVRNTAEPAKLEKIWKTNGKHKAEFTKSNDIEREREKAKQSRRQRKLQKMKERNK